jgi:hypothetical protein
MQLSTAHETLPDASPFADILDSELKAPATFGTRVLQFKAIELPPLIVPSGKITASDGYIPDAKPFTQPVPAGDHPLTLAIAVINNDERIAFAQVRFSKTSAMRWSMALVPGQDAAILKPEEIFGYGVDSGTGCFADSKAYEILSSADRGFADRMMGESQKVYRHTRDWLSIQTDSGSIAVFSSGYGDGRYASYFGHSVDGDLVSLVTDFGLAKWAASP